MDLGVRGHGYLVVGGTRGMGLAAARALVAEGASVAIAGRDPDAAADVADALAAEAHTAGPAGVGLGGDVTVAGRSDRLVAGTRVADEAGTGG